MGVNKYGKFWRSLPPSELHSRGYICSAFQLYNSSVLLLYNSIKYTFFVNSNITSSVFTRVFSTFVYFNMFPLPAATITTSLPHDVPVAESFTLPQHGPIDTPWLTEELKYFETCLLVLDVLESFGTHISKDPASPSGRWAGKPKFLGHVYHWVRKNEPIQLTMPAFPCKSVRISSLPLSIILIFANGFIPLGQPRKQGHRSLARPR